MQKLGAGEILLTSMDRDGTREGLRSRATRAVAEAVDVPSLPAVASASSIISPRACSRAAPTRFSLQVFSFRRIHRARGEGIPGNARNRNQALIGGPQWPEEWLDRVKWDEQGLVPRSPRRVSTDKVLTARLDEPRVARHDRGDR